jgi:hypothetical protein
MMAVGALAADADPVLGPSPSEPVPAPVPVPSRTKPADLTTVLGTTDPLPSGVQSGAWWIRWDQYRTLVVIDDAGGQARSAWVVTYEIGGALAVAYRALVSREADGGLRIDAHAAVLNGPQAAQWSPDSFIIGRDRLVTTRDDDPAHPGNQGEVERHIDPQQDGEGFHKARAQAQAAVGDGT